VNNKQNKNLKAFDLPLAYMYNEKLNQPFFSANYIEGFVQPLPASKLPGDIKFKIWFY